MGSVIKEAVTITTDASGDATAYTGVMNGLLYQICYMKTDFDTGVDFAITVEDSGENVWTESNVDASTTRAPRQATHATDGSASYYTGSEVPVEDKIAIGDSRVKIVISNGGNTKTGTFYLYVE